MSVVWEGKWGEKSVPKGCLLVQEEREVEKPDLVEARKHAGAAGVVGSVADADGVGGAGGVGSAGGQPWQSGRVSAASSAS